MREPSEIRGYHAHRAGLSVLVHPMTGDEVADHDRHPLWLGPQLPIDLEFLRRVTAG